VSSVIDFEDERHRVKLVRDSGETRLYENRGDVDCPVCGEAFDEGLVTVSDSRQVTPGSGVQLCIARGEDELYLFTHA